MYPTTYTHQLTGVKFTATGPGEFGAASAAGTWPLGVAGTIWPEETLQDGRKVWVADSEAANSSAE